MKMEPNCISFVLTIFSAATPQAMAKISNGADCIKPKRCQIEDDTLRFIQIGDWGGRSASPFVTKTQKLVADAMDKLHKSRPVHFVLSAGDNFYWDGVQDVNDTRFKDTFEDVYDIGKSDNLPWYIVAGNHDHHRNVHAQVEYSRVSRRWIFPNLSYVASFELTKSNTIMDFIMVDTTVLCRYPGTHTQENSTALSNWITQELKDSTADYVFVVGHYTIFSTGSHGNSAYSVMMRLYYDMVEYKATAYLYGHDHHLEHLKSCSLQKDETVRVLHHFISGAGSTFYRKRSDLSKRNRTQQVDVVSEFYYAEKPDGPTDKTKFDDLAGGFIYAELGVSEGEFEFYNGYEKKLYTAKVVPKSKPAPCWGAPTPSTHTTTSLAPQHLHHSIGSFALFAVLVLFLVCDMI